MSASAQRQVPATPRVISPSPTPSDTNSADYFGPVTRSSTRRSKRMNPQEPPISEDDTSDHRTTADDDSSGSDPDGRARSRSRSHDRRRMSGMTGAKPKMVDGASDGQGKKGAAQTNGHLRPESAAAKYWRELSRSPSPLGLIPIHQSWRSFIHRHEIPRKALHVSIGFLTLGLYTRGSQPASIHPVLLYALVPIGSIDLLRHNWPSFNRLYIRVMGAFMRESEAYDKYNGVIWYLLGAWAVLRFFPKDVGAISVVLLSWCDTAASTFGRLYGRYTPRLRRGKSLAGSVAAFTVGVMTAAAFWGWIAPRYEDVAVNVGDNTFAFQGRLGLPEQVRGLLGWNEEQSTAGGGVALGVMSVVAGLVASVSEAVDIFGWDDNVTIPVLCGVGLWGFLKVFGAA